ncbi:MAG: hypothetical protein Kow0047_25400 [Anaerolineae bacterium]
MTQDASHTPEIDPQRQERARAYGRLRRRVTALNLLLTVAFLLAWWLTGITFALRDVTASLPAWAALAIYALILGLAYLIVQAPLTWYSGYVLPHRYGLSTQTPRQWLADEAKATLLGSALGLALLEGVYALMRSRPDTWWLWAAISYLGVTVVLAQLAPVLIAPLFYKFTPLIERSDDPEQRARDQDLARRLTALAERAGTRVRGVYAFDISRTTTAANAALMGLGATRRIVLGDTLLDHYTPDEIEAVLAHELGHHVHGDLGKNILLATGLMFGSFYLAHLALQWGIRRFGFQGLADLAAMPWFLLVLTAWAVFTMPLQNAWSRWRERLADRYALESTGRPSAFKAAMIRLANQNLAELDPPRWAVWLLYSHPPIGQRIRLADQTATEGRSPHTSPQER